MGRLACALHGPAEASRVLKLGVRVTSPGGREKRIWGTLPPRGAEADEPGECQGARAGSWTDLDLGELATPSGWRVASVFRASCVAHGAPVVPRSGSPSRVLSSESWLRASSRPCGPTAVLPGTPLCVAPGAEATFGANRSGFYVHRVSIREEPRGDAEMGAVVLLLFEGQTRDRRGTDAGWSSGGASQRGLGWRRGRGSWLPRELLVGPRSEPDVRDLL